MGEARATVLLIIEDNLGDVRLIREALAEADSANRAAPTFQLLHADSLARGLGCLAEHPVDAVLLDLSIPDSSGLASLQTVLAQAPTVPVVVLAAHEDDELAIQAVRQGAQDYLVKGKAGGDLLVRTLRYALERKRAEESLKQLARAQRLEAAGRIVAQVAHDFNNLLVPLVAYPELISQQLPEGHPALPLCRSMLEAARRMAEINGDMLTLGRRGRTEKQPLDLNGLARQAMEEPDGRPEGLVADLDLAPDLLPVSGSPSQLLRVVANLVSNARDAMDTAGLLRIRTENVYVDRPLRRYNRVEVGEYVRLSVTDTGCGIPPEIADKVFDAFFTTKRSDQRRGSGLGLSIVQAIVEDHQGYVDLESEVGKGTTFTIYLPVHRGPIEPNQVTHLRGGSETILVVDDDRLQRDVAKRMLGKLGYQVEVAASGEEAVAYLQKQQADLLVLDMVMPAGIDGAETYRRALAVRPGQRAIIVSGFAESDRLREAQELGAGPFLRKPVALATLAHAVRMELDRGMTSALGD